MNRNQKKTIKLVSLVAAVLTLSSVAGLFYGSDFSEPSMNERVDVLADSLGHPQAWTVAPYHGWTRNFGWRTFRLMNVDHNVVVSRDPYHTLEVVVHEGDQIFVLRNGRCDTEVNEVCAAFESTLLVQIAQRSLATANAHGANL